MLTYFIGFVYLLLIICGRIVIFLYVTAFPVICIGTKFTSLRFFNILYFWCLFIQTEILFKHPNVLIIFMVICACCASFKEHCLTQCHKYILLCFMLQISSVCLCILTSKPEDHHTTSQSSKANFITPIILRSKVILALS